MSLTAISVDLTEVNCFFCYLMKCINSIKALTVNELMHRLLMSLTAISVDLTEVNCFVCYLMKPINSIKALTVNELMHRLCIG